MIYLTKGFKTKWPCGIKRDITASLVVFAVALPLCVAIAKASGVSTAAGIITAVIGGVVVGVIGGGPLQVSGPTAGLITVLLTLQEELGLATLGAVVIMAGLMQIAAGLLRLGQWFRAVSPAVILGMLSGVGVILLTQQFHVAVDDTPARSPVANFLGMPRAALGIFDGHPGHDGHLAAGMIGILTFAVLVFWKRLAPKKVRAIPTSLAAIVTATVVSATLSLPIQRVEFENLAAGVNVIDIASLLSAISSPVAWQVAITVAFLASAESLLTAAAMDGLHTGARTRYDRELSAQGIGNVLCGVVGALPMAGVIVRSSANLNAGATSRWSAVLHGLWMLAFAILLPGFLRMIPVSALAATLVLTGIRLIQFSAIRTLWKESHSEGLICITVAVAVVAVDLLSGVLIGVALTITKLACTFSCLRIQRQDEVENGKVILKLEGAATFLRLPRLAAILERLPPKMNVHIDVEQLSYIDHSCLLLLKNYEKQLAASGGVLFVDWSTLRLCGHAVRPLSIYCSDESQGDANVSGYQKAFGKAA